MKASGAKPFWTTPFIGLVVLGFLLILPSPFYSRASAPETSPTPPIKNPQLASSLARLLAASQDQAAAQRVALEEGLLIREGNVQVFITSAAEEIPAAESAIKRIGGTVTGRIPSRGWIQAWVPLSSLETLANTPSIQYIAAPEVARLAEVAASDLVKTQGLAPMNAPLWHAAGYRGQGIKIGIIDIGFAGYAALLGQELPSFIVAKNFVDGETDLQVAQGSAHGAAVAEIIHDVAPGAALYFAKIRTHIDLQEAVDWLVEDIGVNIINTSLVWYTLSPGDGTGYFADLVTFARQRGIVWVTAAGNQRRLHWSGNWQDANGNGMLDFIGEDRNWLILGDSFLLPPGMLIEAYLRWSDWEQVDQNIDLCLFHAGDGLINEVDCSENPQTGGMGQMPTEYVRGYTMDYPRAYGIYVRGTHVNKPIHLDLFVFGADTLAYVVPAQSLANLADSPDAITAGAVLPMAPYISPAYSAEGPTKGPGGTGTGGLPKPNLAAYTDALTASQGLLGGTSAAVPHVASAAALLLSAYPTWGPDQVENWLFGQAADSLPPGWDARYGYGRLFLGPPPTLPPMRFCLPITLR